MQEIRNPGPGSGLAAGHRIGSYRIVRMLGAGGMGTVYEARQEPLNRRVAIKTLHAQFTQNSEIVARFLNEAKILSTLEHPSLVQVSDFGHDKDGMAYFVMEYLRGVSLASRLTEQGGRLPLQTVLRLAWQIADVLTVVHNQGVIHRDLKPENLMLVLDPVAPGGERVKLLDFGIAKITNQTSCCVIKTENQHIIGTPLYMSPEQCMGAGFVDSKTDVYSLGCILYFALSGRPPFQGDGQGQLLAMHLYAEPVLLSTLAPGLPLDVAEFIHRLLEKDRCQRPTMTEATEIISKLLDTYLYAEHGRQTPPVVSIQSKQTTLHSGQTSLTLFTLAHILKLPALRLRQWLLCVIIGGTVTMLLSFLYWPRHTLFPTKQIISKPGLNSSVLVNSEPDQFSSGSFNQAKDNQLNEPKITKEPIRSFGELSQPLNIFDGRSRNGKYLGSAATAPIPSKIEIGKLPRNTNRTGREYYITPNAVSLAKQAKLMKIENSAGSEKSQQTINQNRIEVSFDDIFK